MILEDATHEAFGYWPKDLNTKSAKSIITSCETCGTFRVIPKHGYRTFCKQCSSKGANFTKEILLKHGLKGAKNHLFNGGKTKRICKFCNEEFKIYTSKSRDGRGVFCCKECLYASQRGERNLRYNGGKRLCVARAHARRSRDFGYTLLMPLRSGDAGHHITDEYVIGIPIEVHKALGGGVSSEKHRNRVLLWLKENDQEKYEMVISVLGGESLK